MATLTPEALTRSLQSGRRGGVFFLHGEEEQLKEEAASAIVAAHLDPATRDFNLDQLGGTEVDAETLASVAQTPPMMAEWRVVVVRDAQALAGAARAREAVEALLERPLPGLALVLLAHIPAGSKAKFYDRLRREAQSVEFAAMPAADIPGWLMERARAAGLELDVKAARALAAAGGGLGALGSELRKLADYVGERRRITVDDVHAVVSSVPQQNRWEWFDMVAEGRFRDARRTLPVLLDGAESGVGLVLGLGTQFLRIGMALGGEKALAAALPPHQRWLAKRVAGQARRWTTHAVDGILEELLRADRLLKSAPLSDREVLEELLLRMQAMAPRPATASRR